ncbi:hypothetical protein WJ58_06120 [Burkholderia ubonensis]|nr:hypothetical protein WJ58_06120 [Burkholderia ubonensis]
MFKTNLGLGVFLIACAYVFGSPLFLDDPLPLKIAAGVVLATSIGQVAAWRFDGGRGRLWLYGVAAVLAGCSTYFFVAGISWIFYFSSTQMPSAIRIICVGAAVSGTLLWGAMTARQVSVVLGKPEFIAHAFKDAGSEMQYSLSEMQQFGAFSDRCGPIVRIGQGLVLFAVPAVFLAARIRSLLPASADLLLFSTVLLYPCSQFFFGVIVKGSLLMIGMPRRLERIHGKPVVLTGD